MTRSYGTLGPDGRLVAGQRFAGPDGYAAAVLATNPVSYWRLGEPSSTVAVDQMGAHNGTYVNAPTLGVAGLLTGDPDTAVTGNGLTATLGSGMTTGALPALAQWSIAYLEKGPTAPADYSGVVSQVGDIFDIARFISGAIYYYDGSAWTNTGLTMAAAESAAWVWTYDGASLRAYKNGALAYGPVARGRAISSAAWGWLMLGITGNAGGLDTLDEPVVWNRALSASEIAALYLAAPIVPIRNPIIGSLPQLTPVTATAFRLSTYRDVYLSVAVTFNPTAIATATCLVEMSPNNSTWTTLVTKTAPMLAALAGSIDTVDVLVPTGWYVRLTTTNATLGAATWY